VAATIVVGMMIRVIGVEGSLPQLFVGLALLAWAAFGRFAARIVRLDGGGVSGRLTEVGLAAVAFLVFMGSAFLADASRVQDGAHLVRVRSADGAVQIGEQGLAAPDGAVRFEYLQLDHRVLGYRRIIPLALHGQGRLSLLNNDVEQWIANELVALADGRTRRGLLIRLRTEHLRLAPGHSYDLLHRDGQVVLQPVGAT
jgi:hypothetical protein